MSTNMFDVRSWLRHTEIITMTKVAPFLESVTSQVLHLKFCKQLMCCMVDSATYCYLHSHLLVYYDCKYHISNGISTIAKVKRINLRGKSTWGNLNISSQVGRSMGGLKGCAFTKKNVIDGNNVSAFLCILARYFYTERLLYNTEQVKTLHHHQLSNY